MEVVEVYYVETSCKIDSVFVGCCIGGLGGKSLCVRTVAAANKSLDGYV